MLLRALVVSLGYLWYVICWSTAFPLTHEIQVLVNFLYLNCEPKTIIRKERRNIKRRKKKIEQQEEMVLHFAEKIGTILTFLRFLSTNWSHALLYTVGCIKGGQLLSAVPIFTVAHVSNSAVCISQPLNNSNSLEDCKA